MRACDENTGETTSYSDSVLRDDFHCRTCVFWIKTPGDKVLKVELKQRSHGTRRIVD